MLLIPAKEPRVLVQIALNHRSVNLRDVILATMGEQHQEELSADAALAKRLYLEVWPDLPNETGYHRIGHGDGVVSLDKPQEHHAATLIYSRKVAYAPPTNLRPSKKVSVIEMHFIRHVGVVNPSTGFLYSHPILPFYPR